MGLRVVFSLITGMPRTASSFLVCWFENEGHKMTPQYFSEQMGAKKALEQRLYFRLCEPIQLTRAFNTRISKYEIIKELRLIEEDNEYKFEGKKPVLKCSQFVFHRDCLDQFERVIICIRDIDSWVKSAENNGSFAWIRGDRPHWLDKFYYDIINSTEPERELGKVWLRESLLTYEYCINKGIPVDIYEYDNDLSFKKLHLSFGLEPKAHKDYDYYIGRRF
jgi:hypothetical protein